MPIAQTARSTRTAQPAPAPTRTDAPGLLRRRADLIVLILVELLVLRIVFRSDVFRNVLPMTGDHSGHVYAVSAMFDQLHHGRWDGWSNGWLGGFPVGIAYPIAADLVASLLTFIMPVAIAYKVVLVLVCAFVPVGAYIAARWAKLPPVFPALFAVFMLPQLLDVSCSFCGGSLDSTFAGEVAYQLGIPLGLLAVAAVVRALRNEGSRSVAALLVGLAALAHPVTALWTLCAVVVAVAAHLILARKIAVRALVIAPVALLLALSWWLPFLASRSYLPPQTFVKTTRYAYFLFPASGVWEVVIGSFAAIGVIAAVRSRSPFAIALTFVTALALILFPVLPSSFANVRIAPLWSTGRWLLVAFGVMEVATLARRFLRARLASFDPETMLPAIVFVIVLLLQGIPWGVLPGEHYTPVAGHPDAQGRQHWLGMSLPGIGQSKLPDGINAGYRAGDSGSVREYRDMLPMLRQVTDAHGCGRIVSDQDITPHSPYPYFLKFHLMDQLPLITDGCLQYLVGTRGDSSLNYPAAVSTVSFLASNPEEPLSQALYFNYDVPSGVVRARQMGVKYYLTFSADGAIQARGSVGLTLVGSADSIKVWEISDAAIVAPLAYSPVHIDVPSGKSWWSVYQRLELTNQWGVVPYSPAKVTGWPTATGGNLVSSPALPANTVSNVVDRGGTISFDVSNPGVPVLVRATYFPGWHATGASGPYQATPDFMIVVPKAHHVTLHFGRSGTVWTAWALGWLAILGVVGLAAWDVVERRRPGNGEVQPAVTSGGSSRRTSR